MNKKLEEKTIQENTNVGKINFENTWFYNLEDMEIYLGEDLQDVEFITLPFMINGKRVDTKCATLEDIKRGRKKAPLTDFDKKIVQALNFNPKKK